MEISATNYQVSSAVTPNVPTQTPAQQAENRNLIQAVKKINEAGIMGSNNELTFVMDRATRRPLVRIVNRETKEVIKQFPPEYLIRMAEDFDPR
jgi:uncharacterized FlaG/YvyC family protein